MASKHGGTRLNERTGRGCRLAARAGERVRLRPLRCGDEHAFFASIDDEVMAAQGWNGGIVDAMRGTFGARTRLRLRRSPSELAVVDQRTDEFLGVFGIAFYSENPSSHAPTIGWWLARGARGHGLGAESLGLALDYAHRTLRFDEVHMGVLFSNASSRALIERSGARHLYDATISLPTGHAEMGSWFSHTRAMGPRSMAPGAPD